MEFMVWVVVEHETVVEFMVWVVTEPETAVKCMVKSWFTEPETHSVR